MFLFDMYVFEEFGDSIIEPIQHIEGLRTALKFFWPAESEIHCPETENHIASKILYLEMPSTAERVDPVVSWIFLIITFVISDLENPRVKDLNAFEGSSVIITCGM